MQTIGGIAHAHAQVAGGWASYRVIDLTVGCTEYGYDANGNHIAPIQHDIRQLIALKTLEPNTTLPDLRLLSDRLVDVAAALIEVATLENGELPDVRRLNHLLGLVERTLRLAQGKTDEAG